MEEPDRKVFGKAGEPTPAKPRRGRAALRVAGNLIVAGLDALGQIALYALRMAGLGAMVALRGFGKFCITTWRLAGALDSALWRAVKLLARRLWDACLHGAALAGQVIHSLLLWLPTRTGRAYSSISGVALVISALWIADELRADPRVRADSAFDLRPPIDEEDPILARIEGRYVHLSEIEAAARAGGVIGEDEALTALVAFERGLVESYVEQRLLARAAQDDGLHRAPAVLRRVNAARDRILAASLIQSRVDDEVTPETVERLYLSQREIQQIGDEVRARHILVATGEEAEEVVALLQGGGDFGALARERSLDRATAPLGGEIGWFSRAMMERPLSDVAFSTPVGDIAPPFQTEFGWHVLEVQGRRPTRARPFDDVRDDIEEYLRMRLVDDTLDELEEENRVVYYRPDPQESLVSAPAPALPDDEPVQETAGAAGEESLN